MGNAYRAPLIVALTATLLAACSSAPSVPAAPPPAQACVEAGSAPSLPGAAPVTAASSASAAAASSAPAQPPPPPAGLQQALDAAAKAIASRDWAAADKQLAVADKVAGDEAHLAYLVARTRAARFVYDGDFDRAAGAYLAVIPALAQRPDLQDEFWAHNAMMMLRAAQGDPAAALAENDQATLCAARGTWDPAGREELALQKDRWHRAYYTRMLAESRSGSAKQALVLYAQAALEDYRPHGFADSIAVLEAYFAALDGRREAALAASRRVDPAKNDDVEDLYLVVVGLEAGGDHKAADAVRAVMRKPAAGVRSGRAIMLRWLELDEKGRGFTPWHAASR